MVKFAIGQSVHRLEDPRMSPARWEGPGRRRTAAAASIAHHRAGAPWPTCSCLHCRRARRQDDQDDGASAFELTAKRIRSEGIYPALRADVRERHRASEEAELWRRVRDQENEGA